MTVHSEPIRITSPTLHATIIFTVLVFFAILVMSFIFKVEVVARGQGRVVPVSRVQLVQPEFAGRITAIHVRNGDRVRKGDILVEFDPTDALTNLGTINAEQDRLLIESERINSMATALLRNPSNPLFLEKTLDGFVLPGRLQDHPFSSEQRRLLETEIRSILASLEQIKSRETTSTRSEAVTNANIERVEASMVLQEERLNNVETLLKNRTASRATYLDVQQTYTELERQREVFIRELEQKAAERAALETERLWIIAEMRNKQIERQSQIDSRLATLQEEERAARRRVEGSALKAPATGIVDQLKVYTVGGVSEAGSELLRIVPTNTEIEIEGTFSNQDIGFMEVGQKSNVRLDAYPSERFGFVEGRVSDIAADATEGSDKKWGYVVRVALETPFLKAGNTEYSLRPGMTATIDVTTDKRRIITYFFAPIVRTIQNAIGER